MGVPTGKKGPPKKQWRFDGRAQRILKKFFMHRNSEAASLYKM